MHSCLLWEYQCCLPGPAQHRGRSCYLGWSDTETQTLLTWGAIWRQQRAPSLTSLSMGILPEHEYMITSQGFIFSQWLQYQYLPELPVKHWDIETGFTETEFYLVSILISHREKKKWLHKKKPAKNSSLLHSYIPSLTLPLASRVIPWSLQTKISRTQLWEERKEQRKTCLKKSRAKKKKKEKEKRKLQMKVRTSRQEQNSHS